MPCDSVIRNSVELKGLDWNLLKRTLLAMKLAFVERNGKIYTTIEGKAVEISRDKIEMVGSRYDRASNQAALTAAAEKITSQVKIQVSRQAIHEEARKGGWKVREIFGQANPTFELEKQGF